MMFKDCQISAEVKDGKFKLQAVQKITNLFT